MNNIAGFGIARRLYAVSAMISLALVALAGVLTVHLQPTANAREISLASEFGAQLLDGPAPDIVVKWSSGHLIPDGAELIRSGNGHRS